MRTGPANPPTPPKITFTEPDPSLTPMIETEPAFQARFSTTPASPSSQEPTQSLLARRMRLQEMSKPVPVATLHNQLLQAIHEGYRDGQRPITSNTPIEELKERLPGLSPDHEMFEYAQTQVMHDHIEHGSLEGLRTFLQQPHNADIKTWHVLTSAINFNKLETVQAILRGDLGDLEDLTSPSSTYLPNFILAQATLWLPHGKSPDKDIVNELLSGRLEFTDEPRLTLETISGWLREKGHEDIAEMIDDKIAERNELMPSSSSVDTSRSPSPKRQKISEDE